MTEERLEEKEPVSAKVEKEGKGKARTNPKTAPKAPKTGGPRREDETSGRGEGGQSTEEKECKHSSKVSLNGGKRERKTHA
jgi:hypothetical protein